MKENGPDVIRTHDLPVISRAHHRAMLRAQESALIYPNYYSIRVFIGCECRQNAGLLSDRDMYIKTTVLVRIWDHGTKISSR